MKPLRILLFLLAFAHLPFQTSSAQSLSSILKGDSYVVKAGMSYWSLFDAIGDGSALFFVGGEKPMGPKSHLTAIADVQFSTFGNGGFFYMGTAGVRYYLGQALRGVNAGVWGVYDNGGVGVGAKAGYQVPLGRLYVDLSAGPAYMAGAGGGGTFFMGTTTVGYKLGK